MSTATNWSVHAEALAFINAGVTDKSDVTAHDSTMMPNLPQEMNNVHALTVNRPGSDFKTRSIWGRAALDLEKVSAPQWFWAQLRRIALIEFPQRLYQHSCRMLTVKLFVVLVSEMVHVSTRMDVKECTWQPKNAHSNVHSWVAMMLIKAS